MSGQQAFGLRMTGGDAIVESLIAMGIDRVFGLPGAQLYPLFDALARRSDRVRTYGARHEQTCGYMAFGAARSTGRPAAFAVVPGPGVLNAGAALVTALGCCQPVMCITGQVPAPFLGKGRGHLHELPDQLATLRSITKWAGRIERVEDTAEVMTQAWRQMTSGRPGPVAVEMAWDVMASSANVSPPPRLEAAAPASPSSDEIGRAAALVAAAQRPMIMTGSGAQHARAEVTALAEWLGAPVAAFRGGRGVLAEDHPLSVSSYAAFKLWPETDVLIGIGTRLEMPYMRWSGMMNLIDEPTAPPHLARIDIDPAEMMRLKPHAPVVGDAALSTRMLLDALRPLGRTGTSSRARHLADVREQARRETATVEPQMSYLNAIRTVLPRDGFLVPELSQTGFTTYFGWPVLEPRTYVSEGYQGTLGFGLPTALGVKAANPNRAVVSICGDGGIMFAISELATAAQEKLGIVVVVFNNGAYGNVLRDQRTAFEERELGARLDNPDFVMLARSFGIEADRVFSPAALQIALGRSLGFSDRPSLIEVRIEPGSETSPWPFIHPKR